MTMKVKLLFILFTVLLLQGCSGFHLRDSADLSGKYKKIQLLGVPHEKALAEALELAIEEAGGDVVDQANTKIKISNVREGKRVVAYTSERKARVYLLFLKLNYIISLPHDGEGQSQSALNQRINLDKTFIYDANFALGKAEEEVQIREKLYEEAARLILLSLKTSR